MTSIHRLSIPLLSTKEHIMFSENLERSLNLANQIASDYHSNYITLEHLLLALLDNDEAKEILLQLGVDIDSIRFNLKTYLSKDNTHQQTQIQPSVQLEHSDAFKRVIQRAIFHAQTLGSSEVNGGHVLAGILSETDSHAFFMLHEEGVNKIIINQLLSKDKPTYDVIDPTQIDDKSFFENNFDAPQSEASSIESFAINLNDEAICGRIDPVINRDKEILRLEQILCRRRKNNPILVGESGVGKTAIAEGLARAIVQKKAHKSLHGCKIYSLDLGSLLAGTKYRGDFEKRFKAVLQDLTKRKDAIIFIDEIHSIIGAGSASGGSVDAANLLKPLLTRGNLRCIGATTYQEYRQLFEKDHALSRRFQKIDIKEPSKSETLCILKGLKDKFESHHNVHYSLQSLKSAIDLSNRYMHDRFLPDKAIDIIDEAGSLKKLQATDDSKASQVDVRDIEKIVSSLTQIPSQHITASDKTLLQNLERDLNMLVYGQSAAISSITTAIKLSRSGLADPDKPIGSFLFAGPTGVGKTELAKQLSSILNLKLLRFDMSEYMEKHSSSQLIGAPAGYVGFDQGGQLTEQVIKNPYSVLLLDEIEKAHADLLNLLLQVMDYGQLTDNTGRIADFRHVIIIMTSNCGAVEQCRNNMGFSENQKKSGIDKAIDAAFSPEFKNRLDGIIQFNQLNKSNITQIVDKFISELEVQLNDQNVDIKVSKQVKRYLCENGFDPKMGARPMARLINSCLKKPIADALLDGRVKMGDQAEFVMKDNHVELVPKQKNRETRRVA